MDDAEITAKVLAGLTASSVRGLRKKAKAHVAAYFVKFKGKPANTERARSDLRAKFRELCSENSEFADIILSVIALEGWDMNSLQASERNPFTYARLDRIIGELAKWRRRSD